MRYASQKYYVNVELYLHEFLEHVYAVLRGYNSNGKALLGFFKYANRSILVNFQA